VLELADTKELAGLMDEDEYRNFCLEGQT